MLNNPKAEYQVLKERFGDTLKDVLLFALDVESWPYDAYEYPDQFGIQRQMNTRQYLLTLLIMAKYEGSDSTEGN